MSDNDTQLRRLRDIVGQIIPGEQADDFVQYARLDAFTNEAGEIDEEKVMGHLTQIHAAQMAAPRNWGQYSGQLPGRLPGADARDALAKRHGVKRENPSPGPGSGTSYGAGGRTALQRRHGAGK